MKKEKGALKSQFEKGSKIGSDTSKTKKEAFDEVLRTAEQEFSNAADLTAARKARKAAVARRLSQLREEANYLQRDVAERIGINVITLSGYEVGRSEPPEEVLVRLAREYGVSLDYLLCRTETRIAFDEDAHKAADANRQQLRDELDRIERELDNIRKEVE